MVRNLRQYSKEFKQESVSLALSYGNVNQAAKELGIPGPTLHCQLQLKSDPRFAKSAI